MQENTSLLVTVEDHEAGYKEVEVVHRSGKRETVRLQAPCRRVCRGIQLELQKEQDPAVVVRACLGDCRQDAGSTLLDKLTPGSADLVESVAFALTFGLDFEKKMARAAEAMAAGIPDGADGGRGMNPGQ